MINFLNLMPVLWLYEKISLFKATHTEILRGKGNDIRILVSNATEKKMRDRERKCDQMLKTDASGPKAREFSISFLPLFHNLKMLKIQRKVRKSVILFMTTRPRGGRRICGKRALAESERQAGKWKAAQNLLRLHWGSCAPGQKLATMLFPRALLLWFLNYSRCFCNRAQSCQLISPSHPPSSCLPPAQSFCFLMGSTPSALRPSVCVDCCYLPLVQAAVVGSCGTEHEDLCRERAAAMTCGHTAPPVWSSLKHSAWNAQCGVGSWRWRRGGEKRQTIKSHPGYYHPCLIHLGNV